MENIGDTYIHRKDKSRARRVLLLIWIVVSFIISVCYISVLLTKLVSIDYERPIDTVQDLLNTNKPIYAHPSIVWLLKFDPRERVRQLANKIISEGFDADGSIPKETEKRYR